MQTCFPDKPMKGGDIGFLERGNLRKGGGVSPPLTTMYDVGFVFTHWVDASEQYQRYQSIVLIISIEQISHSDL